MPTSSAPATRRQRRRPAHAVVGGMPLGLRQHEHEQERHQDRAGIDHDRGHAQELRPLNRNSPAVPSSDSANQIAAVDRIAERDRGHGRQTPSRAASSQNTTSRRPAAAAQRHLRGRTSPAPTAASTRAQRASARRRAARQQQPQAQRPDSSVAQSQIDRQQSRFTPCLPARGDFIGSASLVSSYTLSSFSLSKIISSRLRPVRSNRLVSSIASTGQASSHMPQKMQRSSSIVKLSRILLAIGPGAFDADDVDAMRRAGRRTQEAGHALHAALLVLVQPMHAAIDQRIADLRPLLGIADRDLAGRTGAWPWSSAPARTAASTSCPPGPSFGSSIHLMLGSSAFMVHVRRQFCSR